MSDNRFAGIKFEFVRVGGVEAHGKRVRVRGFGANGERHDLYWPIEERNKAEIYVVAFRTRSSERSIGSAVTEYLGHLKRFGGSKRRPLQDSSLAIMRSKLIGILALVDREQMRANRGKRNWEPVYNDRPLGTLTPNACQRLYQECIASGLAADTHRGYLVAVNAFGGWCLERGYLKVNPWCDVRGEGELSKGKAQHGTDEARRFILAAYNDAHPVGGLAAAAVLTLGVRANELLARTVRELDDRGKVLVISKAKSPTGVRRVQIPPVLRARLLRLAEGQGPEALLFGGMCDGTLLGHVKRICQIAGVPEICTHGLRGTHVTLTMEVETALQGSARAVGHANTGVTRDHYLAGGAEQSARAAMLETLLFARDESDDAAAEREERELVERLEAIRARRVAVVTNGHLHDKPQDDYPSTVSLPVGTAPIQASPINQTN